MAITEPSGRPVALMYSGPVHLFTGVGMAYAADLAEVCTVNVVVSSDERGRLASDIRDFLERKGVVFHWIPAGRFLKQHRAYRDVSYGLVDVLKPDIVLLNDDIGVFNVYLARAARRCGIPPVCFQTGAVLGLFRKDYEYGIAVGGARWADARGLPHGIGKAFMRIRERLRHHWHYAVAPVLSGVRPFNGPSSIFLRTFRSCHRDGAAVLIYQQAAVAAYREEEGIADDRIIPVVHPLQRPAGRALYDLLYGGYAGEGDILILADLPPFPGADGSFDEAGIADNIASLTRRLAGRYPDRSLVLKLHPQFGPDGTFFRRIAEGTTGLANLSVANNAVNALEMMPAAKVVISGPSGALLIARALGSAIVVATNFDGAEGNPAFDTEAGINSIARWETVAEADLFSLPQADAGIPAIADASAEPLLTLLRRHSLTRSAGRAAEN